MPRRPVRSRTPLRPATPPPAPLPPLRHPAVLLTTAIATLAVLVSVSDVLVDTDLWQHLTVGKAMWQLHTVPARHLWTWPSYGQPEVLPSWLFRALVWPFWSVGGVGGLFAWRWLTTLGAFGLLWAVARRLGVRGLAPLVVLVVCGLVYRGRSQMRPETLVAVLLALELWILESWRHGGRDRSAWLVAVAWVWANAHISYYLGFVLLGAFWLEAWLAARGPAGAAARARAIRLGWIGLAALGASFVNPFGWRALWQPFEFFLFWRHEPIFRDIRELRPIEWGLNWRNGLPALMVGWPILLLWRARRSGLDRVELMLCAFFTALSLFGQRFVGFYALVAAPYAARDLDALIAAAPGARAVPLPARAALASLACLAAGVPQWTDPAHPLGVKLDLRSYPVGACDFMAARNVRGLGFNQYEVAGYLLYRFWPERDRLPFIDIHQSGSRTDRSLYVLTYKNPRGWQELGRRYAFDWALLDRGVFQGNRLLDYLDADTYWALGFVDDAAALYVRRDGALRRLAEQDAYALLPGGGGRIPELLRKSAADPAFRARLARELERMVATSAYSSQGHAMLANLAVMEGRLDEARRQLRSALALNPFSYQAHQQLGAMALVEGRPEEALREFAAERRMNGEVPELAFKTGQAYRRLGDLERAARWYRRELKRDPGFEAARDSLAAITGGG